MFEHISLLSAFLSNRRVTLLLSAIGGQLCSVGWLLLLKRLCILASYSFSLLQFFHFSSWLPPPPKKKARRVNHTSQQSVSAFSIQKCAAGRFTINHVYKVSIRIRTVLLSKSIRTCVHPEEYARMENRVFTTLHYKRWLCRWKFSLPSSTYMFSLCCCSSFVMCFRSRRKICLRSSSSSLSSALFFLWLNRFSIPKDELFIHLVAIVRCCSWNWWLHSNTRFGNSRISLSLSLSLSRPPFLPLPFLLFSIWSLPSSRHTSILSLSVNLDGAKFV